MEARGNIHGVPGGLHGPGNLTSSDTAVHSHWARITGNASGTNRYSHKQIDDGDIPTFADDLADSFGAAGTTAVEGYPAYELNGRTDVPTGAIVRVTPGGDLSFVTFVYDGGGGGAIQVEDADESPSVSDVTQLRFNSPFITVSTPGAGIAVATFGLSALSREMGATPHEITTPDAWEDVSDGADVSLSLTAGTWLVFGVICGRIWSDGPNTDDDTLFTRLRNTTDGATVPGSFLVLEDQPEGVDAIQLQSVSFVTVYTVASGTKVCKLQVYLRDSDASGASGDIFGTTDHGTGSSEVGTSLRAVRIA